MMLISLLQAKPFYHNFMTGNSIYFAEKLNLKTKQAELSYRLAQSICFEYVWI